MKFSIRDLLLVTVIVALAGGWWVDHRVQLGRLRTVGGYLSKLASQYGRYIYVYNDGKIVIESEAREPSEGMPPSYSARPKNLPKE